ncbi:dihydrofolate reductase family protein [Rhodobium gokarnense]|uniref:5-amino-6-(5-phosphoribosylamino)uracil reductase n=1 Tax=Rhodobium gokarnense TaxID=364296 RepID=A0ABT3HET3_9HYPH|nr:dihydrofolate reductase family protein [Rhodobium gokarnense]MCW2308907.1 5-amino-6-(5-phosphoribosylamino)uracil reductase [Rhodobium gokarnense]
MPRPEIICHMVTSLDGRLLPDRWPVCQESLSSLYDSVADRFGADGWIVGRKTMEHYLATGPCSTVPEAQPRADVVADAAGRDIGICFDRQGRLRPETGEVDGDHLVLVLSERVSKEHADDLAARGVSVFFAGPDGDDIAGVLPRIAEAFGARRLLLEGGGQLNGAFLAADLIDETSTLILPVIDGKSDVPAIYDNHDDARALHLDLISVKDLDDGTVWLRHSVKRA